VSGYHGGNDDAISCEVTKGLKPTSAIFFKGVPFKEGSVERVCIVNEFLEILQGDLGRGRGTPQVLKEMIEAVGPEMNNDIVFLRYVFERRRNARCQWYCQEVEHQLGKAGKHVELIPTGRKRR
jgi:hypothetical protein